jgi:hypothetical protein
VQHAHAPSTAAPGSEVPAPRYGPGVRIALAVLLGAAALAASARASAPAASSLEPRLGRVASALAGRTASVHCWNTRGWSALVRRIRAPRAAGVTNIASGRIDLSPDVCYVLHNIRKIAARDLWVDPTLALQTLAHESQHVAGYANEAVAECRGLQLVAREGVLLGVPRGFAQDFAIEYWLDAYQYLPRRYRSHECRNGGRLDMRPHSNVWP